MKIGYWGPVTATVDWCEENYVMTYYIAEFWNTLSNWLMIVYPLIYLWHTRWIDLPFDIRICFFSLTVVGLGSTMFHMTLLYPMQLMDELPMIWCSCILLYSLFKVDRSINSFKTIVLFLYSVLFTVMYLFYPVYLFMNVSYGLLVIYTTYKSYMMTHIKSTSDHHNNSISNNSNSVRSSRQSNNFNSISSDCGSVDCNKLSRYLFYMSSVTYALGFLFWNIDNNLCDTLRSMRGTNRAEIPTHPLNVASIVTQFHAWWHLFSGYGSYICLLLLTHMSLNNHDQRTQLSRIGGILPIISVKHPDERK